MPAYDWEKMRRRAAYLALADGSVFRGHSAGAARDAVGEAVFNTGMTGYQEILSDPSYAGQFVCLTFPEIGNYGVNNEDDESGVPRLAGLLTHRVAPGSSWRSRRDLTSHLLAYDIPALAGIDTRALTLRLREAGSQNAFLCASGTVPPEEGVARARAWEGLDGRDLVSAASCAAAHAWDTTGSDGYPGSDALPPPADRRLIAYDFGIKRSLLRALRGVGFAIIVVPARTTAAETLALRPDGVFLSNGPGDPAAAGFAAETVAGLLGRVPIMGVCIGHQLLALACGAKTYRLRFGHHGCNHPVKDLESGRTLVTSQNHNFAVDVDSFPVSRADVTHVSLNDASLEGIRLKDAPAFSVQFHPEAGPGPNDGMGLFARFRELVDQCRPR